MFLGHLRRDNSNFTLSAGNVSLHLFVAPICRNYFSLLIGCPGENRNENRYSGMELNWILWLLIQVTLFWHEIPLLTFQERITSHHRCKVEFFNQCSLANINGDSLCFSLNFNVFHDSSNYLLCFLVNDFCEQNLTITTYQ